jgi:hypothetical protein
VRAPAAVGAAPMGLEILAGRVKALARVAATVVPRAATARRAAAAAEWREV